MNCSTHRVRQWDFYIVILLKAQRHYQEWDSKNEKVRKSLENDWCIH